MTDQPGSEHKESMETANEAIIIPVLKEDIEIAKQTIETGRVRIEKDVIDEQVSVEVSLQKKSVNVTRVPKNQDVEVAPQVRREGNVTIIPVVKEVVVVQKKLVLVEEIHIQQAVETEIEEVQTTVRKEKVKVTRSQ